MKWRELHTSPVVVWISLILGVAGLAYGIWTNQQNQPKYEISYYQGPTSAFMNLDVNGPNELTINGQSFTQGLVYSNILYIWNSGNQPITANEIGEPLQWAGAPSTVKTSYFGIRNDQVEGDIRSGLRFKLLYPNTGLAVNFYSSTVPEINMSGSVSGGKGGSGLQKRSLWDFWRLGYYIPAGLVIVISAIMFRLMAMADRRPFKEIPRADKLASIAVSLFSGGMIMGIFIIPIILGFLNSGVPPF